jgi:predicted SAM-dependent methyltransferase
VRLDIGSGTAPADGDWTTVDLYEPADVKADMCELPYPDASIEEIRCSHALEHLTRTDGARALREFRRVLQPGGTLTVEVPDLESACKVILSGYGDDWSVAYRMLYGEATPGMQHLSGYDWNLLMTAIREAGFEHPTIETVRSYGVTCLRATAVRG